MAGFYFLIYAVVWISNGIKQIKNNKKLRQELLEKENYLQKLKKSVEDSQQTLLDREKIVIEKENKLVYKIDQTNLSVEKSFQKLKLEVDKATERKTKINEAIEKVIYENSKSFPWAAKIISDYIDALDDRLANYLEMKARPAKKSADIIREIKGEKRKLEYDYKIAQYTVDYYESLFPSLKEYTDDDIDELSNAFPTDSSQSDGEEIFDPAIDWLSKVDYEKLSHIERLERALENYFKYSKSRWEKGKKYERYIGYYFENKGYSVNYHGIEKRLEDLGIDLICKKQNETLLIQCKHWKSRLIREASVNQLFGTSVKYTIENFCNNQQITLMFSDLLSNYNVIPMMITSSRLTDTAKNFANVLGIKVYESIPLERYPIIKCNINRQSNEKIYHLPFDQQYDNTIVEPERGEFFASTIAEAEKKKFRRAYKWRGN